MKFQAPIYPVESWSITETEFSEKLNYRNETTFALSNGYLGTRGTFVEGYDFDIDTGLEGNFINGFYESEHVRYGEWNYGFPTMSQSLLNLPDCKRVEIYVDGERFDLRRGRILSYGRTLHMNQGVVTREVEWESDSGKQVRFCSCQLVCLNRKNLMALKLSVTPLNFSGNIKFVSKLDADVENHTRKTNPLVDYGPFGRCINPDVIGSKDHRFFYQGTTRNSGLTMACAAAHKCNGEAVYDVGELGACITYTIPVEVNTNAELTKYIAYSSSLDMPIEKLESFLMEILDVAETDGFAVLLNEQKCAMDAFWQAADIQIDGDEALQQGLRFNLFHIMQSSGRDGKTGMGAKGLSGEGYEGHYFWDTEMYVLPVFIWTNPELAKQLLLYRYHTLPQARERAKVLGHPIGALYPWRTINGEEASTYFPLGTAQYHINGDIAYAVWQYYEATGDYAFLRDYGAEMLVETARVFADVGGFAECRGGRYCICAVTGPDEYNAIVDNNLYTNLLAQENLYAALRSLEILGADADRLNITEEEKSFWKKVADNMYLPYDEKLGVYLQDDGFMMRKPYDENSIPEDKRHLLYENYHPLFVYRQRMSKQADAIYGLQLLSDRFTNEELLRNYEFYQTVTLHHSSLSTSIFGMLACRVGKVEDACRYFSESARMDLDDYHENFYAGIHAANMAGTWQSIVFGFAGLRRVNGVPEFAPILPEGWKGYAFSIRYQGSLLKVSVSRNGAVFTLENEKPITFCIRDRKVTLKKKEIPAMKQYKAIFFDWDGTAVLSRKAPVEDAVNAMRPLLEKGVKLAIISGTTYENIAGGKLESYFTPKQLQNLYLGLGRGAYDYGFDTEGKPVVLKNRVPDAKGILAIHDACYRIHRVLLEQYGMNTDIVFSRPNYCKIDLMPDNNRGDNLFLQEGEAAKLQRILTSHGIESIETLIKMAESFGTEEMPLPATTDAKYLEVGPTGKCDNANALFERFGFDAENCCFWGDEFIGVTDSIFGSDAGMLTEKTCKGDFFDVSNLEGVRPQQVKQLGGGIQTFLDFLREQ